MTCSQLQSKLVSNSGMWVVTWLGVVLWLKLAFSAKVRRMAGKAIKSINRYSGMKRGPGKLTIRSNSMDLLNISFKLHTLDCSVPSSLLSRKICRILLWLYFYSRNLFRNSHSSKGVLYVHCRYLKWFESCAESNYKVDILRCWDHYIYNRDMEDTAQECGLRPGTRILTQAMMPSSRNKSQGHNNKTFGN